MSVWLLGSELRACFCGHGWKAFWGNTKGKCMGGVTGRKSSSEIPPDLLFLGFEGPFSFDGRFFCWGGMGKGKE